jgi:hypothetical protein
MPIQLHQLYLAQAIIYRAIAIHCLHADDMLGMDEYQESARRALVQGCFYPYGMTALDTCTAGRYLAQRLSLHTLAKMRDANRQAINAALGIR